MEEFLRQYGPIGIFLGAGFEGQTAVIVGGLLARQHILQLWLVLLSATAGSGLVDHLLFVAGRRFRSHRWVVRATSQVAFARALAFIERFPISYILAFRFIFGLRVASPIAIGVSRVPTWRFTVLNIAGAMLWATSFTMLGFIFGEAVHNLLGPGHHAGRWTLIAAGGINVAVALAWAVRYLLRRRKAAAKPAPADA
jgi:membrane protein DedA with SNARE-associated domain